MRRNGTVYSTAFTVSDRGTRRDHRHPAPTAPLSACRQPWPQRPGHDRCSPAIFPLQVVDLAACSCAPATPKPAATWPPGWLHPGRRDLRDHEGRRHHGAPPDLQLFAAGGLKIGTIADLIQYRSRTESLLRKVARARCRPTTASSSPMRRRRPATRAPGPGQGQGA